MMIAEKMIACLKVNGKILREVKDTVFVPFGSEYSILLKNLNSVRALVNIQIDGQEVCSNGLVLDANREVDLERFVKDGNLSAGNKFKFIERTASVEKHRGVKAEDGIIRISFKYEKPQSLFVSSPTWQSQPWPGYYPPGVRGPVYGNGGYNPNSTGDWHEKVGTTSVDAAVKSKGITRGLTAQSGDAQLMNATFGTTAVGSAQSFVNDAGITVPGSVSNQKFTTTTMGALESEEHVIVLRILGETEHGEVVQPVTVKARPRCTTCNRVNKATARFCTECGTGLILI